MNKIDVNAITAYCTQATTRIQIVFLSKRSKAQRQRDINGESKRIEKDICQKYTKGDVELANIAVLFLKVYEYRLKMLSITRR